MNMNPGRWDWTQWLATIMYLVLIKVLTSIKILTPNNTDFLGGAIIGKIDTNYLPLLIAIAIIVSAVAAQLYVYGFYVDVTLEYVMLRLAVPAGILGTALFLLFTFSMPLKMSFNWKGAGILIITFLLYAVSIYLCYRRVEFRLVDMPDLEQLEHDMQMQAEMMGEDEIDDRTTKNPKRLRR